MSQISSKINLILGVKLKTHRKDDDASLEADAAFREIHGKVLKRDNMTCQGCGMKTKAAASRPSGGFEAHHIDDDHANNAPENLVTLCPFCHAVFHVGNAGNRDVGSIIWLPGISQADLNILCHVLFILMRQGEMTLRDERSRGGRVDGDRDQVGKRAKADTLAIQADNGQDDVVRCGRLARDCYEILASYKDEAVRHLGPGMDSAEYFGKALAYFARKYPKEYEKRARFMAGARFLPRYEAYPDQIEHWRKSSNYPEPLIAAHMLPVMLSDFKERARDAG